MNGPCQVPKGAEQSMVTVVGVSARAGAQIAKPAATAIETSSFFTVVSPVALRGNPSQFNQAGQVTAVQTHFLLPRKSV